MRVRFFSVRSFPMHLTGIYFVENNYWFNILRWKISWTIENVYVGYEASKICRWLCNGNYVITFHEIKTKRRCIVFVFQKKHRNQQFDTMVNTNIYSLHTLPVEFIYRILDNLSLYDIVLRMINVSTRLDAIVCSYHRNEVSFIYRQMKIIEFILLL